MGREWRRWTRRQCSLGKTGESEQKLLLSFILLREPGPVGVETRKEVREEGGTPVTQDERGSEPRARAASSSQL